MVVVSITVSDSVRLTELVSEGESSDSVNERVIDSLTEYVPSVNVSDSVRDKDAPDSVWVSEKVWDRE